MKLQNNQGSEFDQSLNTSNPKKSSNFVVNSGVSGIEIAANLQNVDLVNLDTQMSEEEKEELDYQHYMTRKKQRRNKDVQKRSKQYMRASNNHANGGYGVQYYSAMVQEVVRQLREITEKSNQPIGMNNKNSMRREDNNASSER